MTLSFDLGELRMTPHIASRVAHTYLQTLLGRHQSGDWGKPPVSTRKQNELNARKNSGTISSRHSLSGDREIWIITQGGRGKIPRHTFILFPEEYQ